jgi:CheY-like chemotaxis protein
MTSMTDRSPRVLLVEDDPVSAAFLQAALERAPARVETASTCARARILARSADHALLVVDANLPDGRGDALLLGLRKAGITAPAIAHTASREEAEHEQLLAAGFLEVLVKPLSAAEVMAAVRRVFGTGDACAPSAVTRTDDEPLWDDRGALDALLGDRSQLQALRGLFVVELRSMRVAIAAAVDASDVTALAPILHRLRASCAFVGAARLCAATEALVSGDPTLHWPRFDAIAGETLATAPVAAD